MRLPREKEAERVALRHKMVEELSAFRLRTLSLEGCTLDRRDFRFLGEFLAVQGATLASLNLGLWNYRQMADLVPPLLSNVKKVREETKYR